MPAARMPARTPPITTFGRSWRELWLSGHFFERSFHWDTQFSSKAKERALHFGIGSGPMEELDLAGTLQPIAFVAGGYHSQLRAEPEYEEFFTFREEQPPAPWSKYAWDAHGHPHTSALYSPWQMLYADDVLRQPTVTLSVETLLLDKEQRDTALSPFGDWWQSQLDQSKSLDVAWRPLVKLLVALGNRYWPEVSNRVSQAYDRRTKAPSWPFYELARTFDASAFAAEMGVDLDEVKEAYWFLVERGLRYEPQDGMELLRRARPVDSHSGWRGHVRLAQDHFDAAAMLRHFLIDLTGETPSATPDWPLDGRQPVRQALYDRGPSSGISREQLLEDLERAGLYPHSLHLIGEGPSELQMVWTLVAGLLGTTAADDIRFTNLGGSGSASRIPTMLDAFTSYARRTVLIVDNEGDMAQYVTGAIRAGKLDEADVLFFKENLEDSNFSHEEQLAILVKAAADPVENRSQVSLTMTLDDVEAEHAERVRRSREKSGFAGTLLSMAKDPNHGGPFSLSKPAFAALLGAEALDELGQARGDEEAIAAIGKRRPVLKFVLDRVTEPLMAPRWREAAPSVRSSPLA